MNWNNILTELAQNSNLPLDHNLLALVHNTERIFLSGSGRSGLALKAFAMRLSQLGKQVFVVGETTTPAITASDLLIVASSSGETKQLVDIVTTATQIGADLWLWSTNDTSAIARKAKFITLLAGKSKFSNVDTTTIQPMGSLFEQSVWLFGDLFVLNYMKYYQISEISIQQRHANLE